MIKGDRRGLEGAKQPIHLEEIEGSLEVME
jgi:hypothetical protein